MKKLFALFMVVAMLAVAGTAMADITVTASPASITVEAGSTATATLSVSGGDHPRGDVTYEPSVSWASVAPNGTITFSPVASATAGQRTVTVEAVELYTVPNDVAGHGTISLRDTGSVTITVNVTRPTTPVTPVTPDTTNTITKVVIITTVVATNTVEAKSATAKIVSVAVQSAVSITKFADVVKPVAQQVTAAVSNLVAALLGGDSSGGSTSTPSETTSALAEVLNTWATPAKTAEVQENAVASINTPQKRASLFAGSVYAGAKAALTEPQDSSQLKPAVSSTTSTSTADKLVGASQKLGEGQKALSAGDAVTPQKSGTYKFPQVFGPKLYKTPIKGNRGIQAGSRVNNSSFTASAEGDEEGIAFVNSAGTQVTEIPDDSDPDNVMPGYVNMMVVMEAGEVYEPVIYTTDTELSQAIASNDKYADPSDDAEVDAEAAIVDTDQVEYASETQQITVEVDPATGEETQIGEAKTIEDASGALTTAMANALSAVGIEGVETVNNALKATGVTFPDYDATTVTDEANKNNYFIAGDIPAMAGLADGAYYVETTISQPTGRELVDDAEFKFFPNGFDGGARAALVLDANGVDVTATPSAVSGKAYLVFVIENSAIRAATYDITAPVLAVSLKPVESGENNIDPAMATLIASQWVDASGTTITAAGFGGVVPSFSAVDASGNYNATINLMFPVTSWQIEISENNGVVTAMTGSAVSNDNSKITANADGTSATVQLSKVNITKGTHTVTLRVHPEVITDASKTVSAQLGTVEGNPDYIGVGSSSGGCSAGFAGLAMAVLGAFIVTRKK